MNKRGVALLKQERGGFHSNSIRKAVLYDY